MSQLKVSWLIQRGISSATRCKMKQFYLRVIACTLSVVLLYPAFAVSQTNTGSLSGTVIDVMGIAYPKAKVWATRSLIGMQV